MKLIDAFYSQFSDIEIKILRPSKTYIVELWRSKCCKDGCKDCSKKILSSKNKYLTKALHKAFNTLADMQGEAPENILEYKAIFQAAYDKDENIVKPIFSKPAQWSK